MLGSIKRVVPTMLVLSLLFSVYLMPVEAKQMEEKALHDAVSQMRFSYIDYYRNNFDISSNGLASISSFVLASNVDHIVIVGNLQQFVNGNWVTIKLWSSNTTETYHSLEKEWYVTTGHYYRYKSYAYMYNNGSMVESTVYTSGSEYY